MNNVIFLRHSRIENDDDRSEAPVNEQFDEKRRILSEIIPEINCPQGCSSCCEIGLALTYNKTTGEVIKWVLTGKENACDQFVDGKCKKYLKRSIICRTFFKSEDGLTCFKGLKPQWLLTKEEMRRIIWCAGCGTINDAKALYAISRKTLKTEKGK